MLDLAQHFMEHTVTLETKCYERDWRRLLQTDRLRQLADRNGFAFAQKVLIINNVKHPREVARQAQAAVEKGWLTQYYVAEDHAAEALKFFSLSREALGKGYVYAIAELVSIYLCQTEFLLHFAGDCLPEKSHAWIPQALQVLNEDSRVRVANLLWNGDFAEAKSESSEDTGDFFKGFGFSDQCYLVRTADFRQPIYNHSHPASARYPEYGGELFEKRVDAWMRCHGHLRATYKHASYLHQNVPPTLGKRIQLLGQRVQRSVTWRINRLTTKLTGS
jgi:hypothetical protein